MQVSSRLPKFVAAFLIAALICLASLLAPPAARAQTQYIVGPNNSGNLQQSGNDAVATNIGQYYYENNPPGGIPILAFVFSVNGTPVDWIRYYRTYGSPDLHDQLLSGDPLHPTTVTISWTYPLPTGPDSVEFVCDGLVDPGPGPWFDLKSDMTGAAAETPKFDPSLEAPAYGLTLLYHTIKMNMSR